MSDDLEGGCGCTLNAFAMPDGRYGMGGHLLPKATVRDILNYFIGLHEKDWENWMLTPTGSRKASS